MSSQNAPTASRPLPPPPPDWQTEEISPPKRKSNWPVKVVAILIVLLLLFLILFYTPIGKDFMAGLTGDTYAASSDFTVQREITIDISSGEINWVCDIPVPKSISGGSIQAIESAVPSPLVSPTESDGSEWIEWTGTDDSFVTLSMTYRASVKTVIWDISPEESGMASDIPEDLLESQGGNEWAVLDSNDIPTGEYKIWPDNSEITELSDSLTSPELTVLENTRSIYDYLRDNLDYRTVPGSEPKSCLDTLEDGTGDCDDQSMLLISLLRAAGIPAWLAFGVLYDGGSDAWGAHAWAEVYMPLADGNGGSVVIDIVNDEFLVRNCNRLEEWKSDGNGEHLSDYYHILSYNYTLANPHQQPPDVDIGDEYSGEYDASAERVYATIRFLEIREDVSKCELASRKVF
uniref:Transglutaminase-like domain-containing protein n=1 Tax=uncultured Thermoplasmata archaeon TaxID=376542 RepID=A0A871YDR5_9ARCH|nr:Transglutaminase domain-containing protein [uncultured Thermoplasmata archaeon]